MDVAKLKRQKRRAAEANDMERERRVTIELAVALMDDDSHEAAHKHLREAILLNGENDPLCHRYLADCLLQMGDIKDAIRHRQKHLSIARATNDQSELQRALNNLGTTFLASADSDTDSTTREDDLKRALDALRESYSIARRLSSISAMDRADMIARCLLNMALVMWSRNSGDDLVDAINSLNEALTLAKKWNILELQDRIHSVSADIYAAQEDQQKAVASLKEALGVQKTLNDVPSQANTIHRLGVLTGQSDIVEGLGYLKAALKLCKGRQGHSISAETKEAIRTDIKRLKRKRLKRDRLVNARRRAAELAQQPGPDYEELATLYEEIGDLYCEVEPRDLKAALRAYQSVIDTVHRARPATLKTDLAAIFMSMGLTHFDLKQYTDALTCFERELEEREHAGSITEKAECHAARAKVIVQAYRNDVPGLTLEHAVEELKAAVKLARSAARKENFTQAFQSSVSTWIRDLLALLEELGDSQQEEEYRTLLTKFGDPDNSQSEPADLADEQSESDSNGSIDDVLTDSDEDEEKLAAVRRKRQLAQLHRTNERGETQLQEAAKNGMLEQVRKLLDLGAAVNVQDHAGWTPLHDACDGGHDDVVRLLLDHGARVNVRSVKSVGYSTPLHEAAKHGYNYICQMLLEKGADTRIKDGSGKTAIELAAAAEEADTFELLKEHMVDQGHELPMETMEDALTTAAEETQTQLAQGPRDAAMDAHARITAVVDACHAVEELDRARHDEQQSRGGASDCHEKGQRDRNTSRHVKEGRHVPGRVIDTVQVVSDDEISEDEDAVELARRYAHLDSDSSLDDMLPLGNQGSQVAAFSLAELAMTHVPQRGHRQGGRDNTADMSVEEDSPVDDDDDSDTADADGGDSDQQTQVPSAARRRDQQVRGGNIPRSHINLRARKLRKASKALREYQERRNRDLMRKARQVSDAAVFDSDECGRASSPRPGGSISSPARGAGATAASGRPSPSKSPRYAGRRIETSGAPGSSESILGRSGGTTRSRPRARGTVPSRGLSRSSKTANKGWSSRQRIQSSHTNETLDRYFSSTGANYASDGDDETEIRGDGRAPSPIQAALPDRHASTATRDRRDSSMSSNTRASEPNQKRNPAFVVKAKILESFVEFEVPVFAVDSTVEWLQLQVASLYERQYGVAILVRRAVDVAKTGTSLDGFQLLSMLEGPTREVGFVVNYASIPPAKERFKAAAEYFTKQLADGDIVVEQDALVRALSQRDLTMKILSMVDEPPNTLDLCYACLPAFEVELICQSLQHQKTLTELDLSGNTLDDSAATALASVLWAVPNLRRFVLSDTGLSSPGASFIMTARAPVGAASLPLAGLEELDLSYNNLENLRGIVLQKFFIKAHKLKELSLAHCRLSQSLLDSSAMIACLQQLPQLRVDLSGNDAVAQSKTVAVLRHRQLRDLKSIDLEAALGLQSSELVGSAGGNMHRDQPLSADLQCSGVLINPHAEALAELEAWAHLAELSLRDCLLTSALLLSVLNSIHPKVIRRLDLCNNELCHSSTTRALAQVVATSPMLRELDLSLCNLTVSHVCQVLKGVALRAQEPQAVPLTLWLVGNSLSSSNEVSVSYSSQNTSRPSLCNDLRLAAAQLESVDFSCCKLAPTEQRELLHAWHKVHSVSRSAAKGECCWMSVGDTFESQFGSGRHAAEPSQDVADSLDMDEIEDLLEAAVAADMSDSWD